MTAYISFKTDLFGDCNSEEETSRLITEILLMPWLLKSPGYQQPYAIHCAGYHVGSELWHENCKGIICKKKNQTVGIHSSWSEFFCILKTGVPPKKRDRIYPPVCPNVAGKFDHYFSSIFFFFLRQLFKVRLVS